jgi:hypothetical protein
LITFTIKENELKELAEVRFPNTVDRVIQITASALRGEIGREAPVDEGLLAGSYNLKRLGYAAYGIWSRVKYRWWVHEGTGIYGPHKKPIVPVRAKALRFEIDGRVIFAKSVKGQKPNRFIDRAIDTTSKKTQTYVNQAIRETIM